MISETNINHLCAAGATLLGSAILCLLIIVGNGTTRIRVTEQTRKDSALSVEAQVERERSALFIEQERFKQEKFLECIDLIRNSTLSRLEIINPILIQMGCPQE